MDEGSPEPDIVEQHRRRGLSDLPSLGWRPSRGASVMAALALAVGLAAGYAVGHGQGRGTVAAPGKSAAPGKPAAPAGQASGSGSGEFVSGTFVTLSPQVSSGFSGPTLTENPGTCSEQAGRDLELGIPVTNLSGQAVLLESVKPVPLVPGILKVLSWRWGPCGLDHDGIVPDVVVLGPGETTWVTAVVKPLIACPAPGPLQFRVTYSVDGRKSTFNLPGFADLTAVRYSGCPAPAGGGGR